MGWFWHLSGVLNVNATFVLKLLIARLHKRLELNWMILQTLINLWLLYRGSMARRLMVALVFPQAATAIECLCVSI